jgi:nitrate reductase (NAD(P)H)
MVPKPQDLTSKTATTTTDHPEENENEPTPSPPTIIPMMAPLPDSSSSCEKLYGPYPPAVPIPFIANITNEGRSGDVGTSADAIDMRDAATPDNWIPRDGRLVRLTGKHPFNVEPPARLLQHYQFLTPSSLHYVRNHGAVPHCKWETHTLEINCGNGATTTLTMDELASMPARELPVTLVCAGNRRKEQNKLRQTIGFNWGASGVSTNVYRGVPLYWLLQQCGVDCSNIHTKHVEFVGAEDLPNKVGVGPFPLEPWGKTVKYGTSVPLARAMNPAYDILIAYQANGERLQPDHGFPVRLIIPGYIGGRMIKWLKSIRVIEHETRNHYHYHDNRILPPHITAETSADFWYKPEYIFNELNINSAMTSPDHNETLPLVKNLNATYPVVGYAYSGGGRRLTRVEVSTDGGAHWELATLQVKEQPTPYGMYWCWVWWQFDLKVSSLIGCKEVWCRAWDESNNTQPNEPTWNLMGMGNNHIFRVKVHLDQTAGGDHVFRFEHPTQPGQQTGGWMSRASDMPVAAGFGKLLEVQGEAKQETVEATTTTSGKLITLEEVQKHNNEKDSWIIVKDRVYEVTEYLELHPGGIESITINAGGDATEDFVAIHSIKATKMLEKYYIGDLDKASVVASKPAQEEELVDKDGNKLALNPRKKTAFKLQNKIQLSRDTILLDFALPTPQHVLGLPTGKHMFLSAKIDGETVLRRYTPISSNYDVGSVKFVIKVYTPCERFPEGGKMSQYVDTLKIGDSLDMRGPVGEFEYIKNGNFTIDNEPCTAAKFNMIAGGTGITPVMQIAAEILRHPNDPTQVSLIFACREEGDLLMRSTLDEWAANFPHKFKVHYILSDSVPADWKYSKGFVDKQLFEEYLFEPADDVYNLMCGPPIMMDRGVKPNLDAIGHKKKTLFAF